MAEEKPRYGLKLKVVGTTRDARLVSVTFDLLSETLRRRPGHIAALLAFVGTPPIPLPPPAAREFREMGWLSPDGTLKDYVRDTFAASYRVAPDGPCFVDPFSLETTEEARTIDQIDAAETARIGRLVKQLRRNEPPGFNR